MRKYFRAFVMCLTMFTIIPCPFCKWDEEARPLMTLFLPVVGAVVGGLWTVTAYFLNILELPGSVRGAVLCAFPFFITGGIHMDGFLDTVDAVRSRRDIEDRRRILKDPHVGSFAVISACLLIMMQYSLFVCANENADIYTLILIPVVSRTAAALCVTMLRPICVSEYSGAYRKGIRRSHVGYLIFVIAAEIAIGFIVLGRYGSASIAVITGYIFYLIRGFRSLDGMSGDISGYALTFGELCGIAVYALVGM